jgi:hypothetical protein
MSSVLSTPRATGLAMMIFQEGNTDYRIAGAREATSFT